MAFVQAILQACKNAGFPPDALLAQAQITPEEVQNPDAKVTAWQFERLSGLAMQALNDEALGWFSRRLPWGSYGMLARASISAPTLGVALVRWCRHHGLLTDDIALHLETKEGVATLLLTVKARCNLGVFAEFCPVSVLRNVHGLACWLIDSRIPLQGVQFVLDAPTHHSVYPLLFPGPVQFSAERTALHFDARYLGLPLARDEAALRQMLQRALPLTVLQYRRDRLLVQRVRQALAAQPTTAHTAETLAQQLLLSPRTLHRQLKEEGASLQGIKDEVRREQAIALLHRTQRPIKQVAQMSGFRNEKSFIRAFKIWTGQSPADFRHSTKATGVD